MDDGVVIGEINLLDERCEDLSLCADDDEGVMDFVGNDLELLCMCRNDRSDDWNRLAGGSCDTGWDRIFFNRGDIKVEEQRDIGCCCWIDLD